MLLNKIYKNNSIYLLYIFIIDIILIVFEIQILQVFPQWN